MWACQWAVATALGHLAELYEEQHRYADAEPLRGRALEIIERYVGSTFPPALLSSLEAHAAVLRKLGRSSEAEKAEAHARMIGARHGPKSYRVVASMRSGERGLASRFLKVVEVVFCPWRFPSR